MKERPILFSGPMVRAILDGRKTQTRRVVKLPLKDRDFGCELAGNEIGQFECNRLSPYGGAGDRLWVRESFQPLMADDVPESDWLSCDYKTGKGYKVSYTATDGIVEYYNLATDDAFCSRITPSIFMPRWASRITLEITGVRVERLQSISEADALAEGVERLSDEDGYRVYHRLGAIMKATDAVTSYRTLWESINGKGAWDANPWVWIVEFRNPITIPQ